MEQHWRKQLKAKAGYVAMAITGTVLSFFFFIGFVSLARENPIGAITVLLLSFVFASLAVLGVIMIIAVVRHNKKIEAAYIREFDAEVAKDIVRIKSGKTPPPIQ